MKIFLISNMYPSIQTPGYGSFIKNVCKGLSNFDLKVTHKAVIKGKAPNLLKKCFKYGNFYKDIIKSYFEKYDFIYLHFPNQAAPLLLLLMKFYSRKIIVNFHGEDLLYNSTGLGNILGRIMERLCKKYCTAIVVPSLYFKNLAIDRKILPDTNKIIVSPSGGINPSIFYPQEKVIDNSKPIHLGYVGRFEKDKGIIEFLEVLNLLKQRGILFTATAIGYGSLNKWVATYIQDNDLQNDLNVIYGIEQHKLGDYYRSFDILLFCSSRKSESLGLTGIEAMACGTPVIGGNVGGIASYLEHGYNGWLVDSNDINSIIDIIINYTKISQEDKSNIRHNCVETGRNYYENIVCCNLAQRIKDIIVE